jgi:signal transduction histidine kinase
MTGLELATCASLLSAIDDPVAVIDERGHCLHLNPALLRLAQLPADLASRPSLDVEALLASVPGCTLIETRFQLGSQIMRAVVFRTEHVDQRQQDRLLAFARTAARAATTGSPQATLDALAREVVKASDAVTCTVLMTERATGALSMIGAAGHPPGYLERVEEALTLGAPLRTLAAQGQRRPRVQRDLAALVNSDDRFMPLSPFVAAGGWTTLVAAPLVARTVELGVLTAFYAEGGDPDETDIVFLAAMADQAAVALDTARLFAELEDRAALDERHRLAPDLHDRVTQSMFAIGLHTRAIQLAARRLDTESTAVLETKLNNLHELAESTVAEMRGLLSQLRDDPAGGDDELVSALRGYASSISRRENVAVTIDGARRPLTLSAAAHEQLFADGNPITMGGHGSDVMRRQSDGTWKFLIDNAWVIQA